MKWIKRGMIYHPALMERPEWAKEFALAPSTIELDNVIRVFFSCRPLKDSSQEQVSYSAFIDLNKDDLTKIEFISDKPLVDLGPLGSFDEFGCVVTSVVKWEATIRAYYIGWSRMRSIPYATAIGIIESNNNGNDFHRIGKGGPIISASLNEPLREQACPIVRIFNGKWYMWYMSGIKWVKCEIDNKVEPHYQITNATSDDGIKWERSEKFIIAPLTKDECQTTPNVFFFKEKYHMFFSYRRMLDFRKKKERSYRIGYASSTDLINWVRDDSKAGITVSENGWDSEMICYPHIFELNNKLIMFYNGNEFGRHGFGYAELESYE